MTAAHALIPEITRWRYWFLPVDESEPVRLMPIGDYDKTVWGPGTVVASCRHDESHVPPHPGCTCGLYAVGAVDVQYAVRLLQWRYEKAIEVMLAERFGYGIGTAMVKARARKTAPKQNPVVIGRVFLNNVVPRYTPVSNIAGGVEITSWRAASGAIEALYVQADGAYAVEALSDRYGAPCVVGWPGYAQVDWEERTRLDGHRVSDDVALGYPTFEEFGLYPPKSRGKKRITEGAV